MEVPIPSTPGSHNHRVLAPHCTPTTMDKGETLILGLKMAFVRAL